MARRPAIEVLPSLKLYRIASRSHRIFDGTGAAIVGARWNTIGTAVIYTSTSLAGAKMELLAHIGFNVLPKNYGFVEISVPESAEVEVYPSKPPLSINISQAWGSAWHSGSHSLLARVPSVASPGEFNFIVNPQHPDFGLLKVSREKVARWDSRHFE